MEQWTSSMEDMDIVYMCNIDENKFFKGKKENGKVGN